MDQGSSFQLDEEFPNFMSYKDNLNFCDVVLKVGDREISAHRIVLAATIPYFEAMFNGNFREKHETSIEIRGINADVLENLISLSYGAAITVTDENVENLILGADYLQMNQAVCKLKNFMQKRLTLQNVMKTKEIGDLLNCDVLVSAALEFIDDNFPALTETRDFLDLDSQEVISIIKRSELRVTEESVYEAVINWVKHSVFDRVDFLPELLSNVRMCLLRPEYLYDVVRNEILIKTSTECKEMLDAATNYHMLNGKRDFPATIANRPRNAKAGLIYVLGGVGGVREYYGHLQIYDPETDQWTIQNNAIESVNSAASAVLDGKLFMFGGMCL